MVYTSDAVFLLTSRGPVPYRTCKNQKMVSPVPYVGGVRAKNVRTKFDFFTIFVYNIYVNK